MKPQGPKVLNALDSATTLDGYNTGLSAAEEVPGSVEPRLSPQLAQQAEFLPAELEMVDGEHGGQLCGLAGGWHWCVYAWVGGATGGMAGLAECGQSTFVLVAFWQLHP